MGGGVQPPRVFENNSRTYRPTVTKLGIPNHWTILHRARKFQDRTYYDLDLSPKFQDHVRRKLRSVGRTVSAPEACELRYFCWWYGHVHIDITRWHPWFTLTLLPFRGQPRSSEVTELWWRRMTSFSVFVLPGAIWCADFEFGIPFPFFIYPHSYVEIGLLGHEEFTPKKNDHFYQKHFLFVPKMARDEKAVHCILKTTIYEFMLNSNADKFMYKIWSSYLQKWLSFDIKHVKNRHFSRHFVTAMIFLILFFWLILTL